MKVGDVACQTLSGMAKENKVRIDCSGDKSLLTGRHVRIEKWDGILTVCEFQVFGKFQLNEHILECILVFMGKFPSCFMFTLIRADFAS